MIKFLLLTSKVNNKIHIIKKLITIKSLQLIIILKYLIFSSKRSLHAKLELELNELKSIQW